MGVGEIISSDELYKRQEDMLNKRQQDLNTMEMFDNEAFYKHLSESGTGIGQITDMKPFYKRVPIPKPEEPVKKKRVGLMEKVSKWMYSNPVGTATADSLGYTLGTLNSPYAFVWGAMNAQRVDPEAYNKMNFLEQSLVSLGGAFHSAWRSISKRGDWGETWDNYFEGTTGKTLHNHLEITRGKDFADKYTPIMSVTMSIISDPMLTLPEASAFARMRAPKHFVKNMPKEIGDELKRLDDAIKAEYAGDSLDEFRWALDNRAQYKSWWDGQVRQFVETGMPGAPRTPTTKSEWMKFGFDLKSMPNPQFGAKPKSALAQEGANVAQNMGDMGRLSRLDPTHGPVAQQHWGDLRDAWGSIISGDFHFINEPSELMQKGFKLESTGHAIEEGLRARGNKLVQDELVKKQHYFDKRQADIMNRARALPDQDPRKINMLQQAQESAMKAQLYREAHKAATSKVSLRRHKKFQFDNRDVDVSIPISDLSPSQKAGAKIRAAKKKAAEKVEKPTAPIGGTEGFNVDKATFLQRAFDDSYYVFADVIRAGGTQEEARAAMIAQNQVAMEIMDREISKMVWSKVGSSDPEKIVDYYVKKWGISHPVKYVEVDDMAKAAPDMPTAHALIRTFFKQPGGKGTRKLIDRHEIYVPKGTPEDMKAAYIRHELEHLSDVENMSYTAYSNNPLHHKYHQYFTPEYLHRQRIKNALAEQKEVPPDVLKEQGLISNEAGTVNLQALATTGGAMYGFELDAEGNIRYNWIKGLAGATAGFGGGFAINRMATKNAKHLTDSIAGSSAWKKVHNSYGDDSGRWSGLLNRELPRQAWNWVERKITDRMRPIKDLGTKEAYNEARKFSSYKERAMQDFDELSQGLAPVRDIEVEFTDYVTAMRDAERAGSGIKNPNGVTSADAIQAMSDIRGHLGAQGFDLGKLDQAVDFMKKWTHDKILAPSHAAGLISDGMYQATKDKFYLAYEILDHMPDLEKGNLSMALSPEYFSVSNQKVFNKMVGTEKQIADPIESTIKKFINAAGTIERNNVANTLLSGLPESMKVLLPRTQKEFFKLKAGGQTNIAMKTPDGMDVINMFVDGKVQTWAVDQHLADAMKVLNQHQAPKFLHAINNVFRMAATTAYLPFTITNAFRDAMLAYTTAPVYKTLGAPRFAKDWLGGLFHGGKHELGQMLQGKYWDATVKDYLAKGGGFGWTGEIRNPKLLKKQLFKQQQLDKRVMDAGIAVIKSPFELTKHISGAVELAPRMAVYKRAMKAGYSQDDAIMMARQATIDFNRGGSWMKAANQWIPFLNARVQGRYTALRALKGKQRANTLAKMATAIMLPAAATYFYNRTYFSEQYDDIPDYIKNNYFVIITGTKTDPDTEQEVPTYFTIPKGDIGLAWNPIEGILEKAFQDGDQGWGEMALDFMSDLSPVQFAREGEPDIGVAMSSVMPPVAKGVVEGVTNRNLYTGLQIVPEFKRAQSPDYLISRNSTPEEYRWLAKTMKKEIGLDISPNSIQNFASNMLAGYGRQGIHPKSMLDGLTGRLYKSKGGAKQAEALEYIHEMKDGYIETKALAKMLFSDGKRAEGMRLIRKWNQGLNKRVADFNKKFKKYDIHDRGGLRRKYQITPKKAINMIIKRRRELTPLEKKLTGRR